MKTKRIATAIAAAAMLANAALPVFATSIEITGNGNDSVNKVDVDVEQNTSVQQSNDAVVVNNVTANSDSGHNDANKNTGGDVSVMTGNAKTDVTVVNDLNGNAAEIGCCGTTDFDVLIDGNGADTYNNVDLDVNHSYRQKDPSGTSLLQYNDARVTNLVNADSNSGRNDADRNTGGDVTIDTGKSTTNVTLSTTANTNSAVIGGSGRSEGGSVSAKILGNGADSINKIDLDLENEVELSQQNYANVYNRVDADSESGKNDANKNTGGDVKVMTGDALTDVMVDNAVNFNWADADCGCLFDLTAKIAENGADTYNRIEADLEDELGVTQWNGGEGSKLVNGVNADSRSGRNDADRNTGDYEGGDPSVDTGAASTFVDVDNAGNSNVFGKAPEWDMEMPAFGLNLSLSIDWEAILAALNLS